MFVSNHPNWFIALTLLVGVLSGAVAFWFFVEGDVFPFPVLAPQGFIFGVFSTLILLFFSQDWKKLAWWMLCCGVSYNLAFLTAFSASLQFGIDIPIPSSLSDIALATAYGLGGLVGILVLFSSSFIRVAIKGFSKYLLFILATLIPLVLYFIFPEEESNYLSIGGPVEEYYLTLMIVWQTIVLFFVVKGQMKSV